MAAQLLSVRPDWPLYHSWGWSFISTHSLLKDYLQCRISEVERWLQWRCTVWEKVPKAARSSVLFQLTGNRVIALAWAEAYGTLSIELVQERKGCFIISDSWMIDASSFWAFVPPPGKDDCSRRQFDRKFMSVDNRQRVTAAQAFGTQHSAGAEKEGIYDLKVLWFLHLSWVWVKIARKKFDPYPFHGILRVWLATFEKIAADLGLVTKWCLRFSLEFDIGYADQKEITEVFVQTCWNGSEAFRNVVHTKSKKPLGGCIKKIQNVAEKVDSRCCCVGTLLFVLCFQ